MVDKHQWTKSSEVYLEEHKWPTLEDRRHYYAVLMLYSILRGFSHISFDQHFRINSFPPQHREFNGGQAIKQNRDKLLRTEYKYL